MNGLAHLRSCGSALVSIIRCRLIRSPGHLGAQGGGHSWGASVLDVVGTARVRGRPVEVCPVSHRQPSESPARGVSGRCFLSSWGASVALFVRP